MFGWRRRSEGFEWREYVRTTVLVRRADRQRRAEDIRVAAVEKVKNAADAGVGAGRAGVSAARSQISKFLSFIGDALLDIAAAAFAELSRWSKFLWRVVKDSLGGLLQPIREALRVPLDAARDKAKLMPDVARDFPIKAHHLISAALAIGLIYVGGPMLRSADGVGAAVVDLAPGSSQKVTISSEISGQATAIAGDAMRVDGVNVRIDGIEAPSNQQPCYRANGRKWNCAAAARTGLSKIIRGRVVTCTRSGQDDAGRTLAQCTVDGSDLATQLVRNGYVFAASSYFSSLGSEETAARNAKAGIWQGEVARPQAWRDQTWEMAKRQAPDGCPIKGVVRASSKIYTLPWSEAYASAKVRPERGERWFCSEDEAKAAGFSSSDRS
ncbi:thermonuclease family protein [Hyphomicrobium sp. 99]|uniref:thermonuclease family protein n=1 Tax=Hyphomicrobium sp. 99 TaxID=1163419 RepID=UPI0005F85BB4|nr:thermonuclease family protein [Hyphomicrobium sp. 99]